MQINNKTKIHWFWKSLRSVFSLGGTDAATWAVCVRLWVCLLSSERNFLLNTFCLLWKMELVFQGTGALSEIQNQSAQLLIHEKCWRSLKSHVDASHHHSSLDDGSGEIQSITAHCLEGDQGRSKEKTRLCVSPDAEQAGRNPTPKQRIIHVAQEWYHY